jgi:hypothetical protein
VNFAEKYIFPLGKNTFFQFVFSIIISKNNKKIATQKRNHLLYHEIKLPTSLYNWQIGKHQIQ